MSDTQRKIIRNKKKDNPLSYFDEWSGGGTEQVVGDDVQLKSQGRQTAKKMTPYSKNKRPKFVATSHTGTAPTKKNKETTKNANRSLKKAERIRLKQETKKFLEDYTAEH